MPPCVKCRDCGFLSLRHPNTRDLHEADDHYRDEGIPAGDLSNCGGAPVCFVRAWPIEAEF